MRYLLTFLATSLFIVVLHGQAKFSIKEQPISRRQIETPPNHSPIKSLKPHEYLKRKASAFWTEDFSNGFLGQGNNGSWSQLSTTNPTTGNTPEWEYRGPNTTPDTAVGSRGSCGGKSPIESNSVNNGFVIFDSNYWDEPAPDTCAGIGTGLAPSPHNSSIISPSINLSSQENVGLFFTVYARNFQAEVNLYAILETDTIFIIDLYEYINLDQNKATDKDQLIRLDLSDIVGLQSDVRFMWSFVGDYYYFSMDDIFLAEPATHDYEILTVWNDDIRTNFEYYDLPIRQSHVLSPGMRVRSRGKLTVDLELEIRIEEPDGTIQGPFSEMLSAINKDSISPPIFISTFEPTQYGEHTIYYKVKSDYDSLNIAGERATAIRNFNINRDTWSDALSESISYFPAPEVNGSPGESESIQLFKPNTETAVFGIETFIINYAKQPDKATFEGDELKLTLYSVNETMLNERIASGSALLKSELFTELASVKVIVTQEMISELGDFRRIYGYFDFPEHIYRNRLIAASIHNSGGGYLCPAVTSPSENTDGSGLFRGKGLYLSPQGATDDDLHQFTNLNPWIKLNVDAYNSVSDNDLDLLVGNAVPNPANGTVTVAYSLKNTTTVALTLTDLSGKVIATQKEGPKNAGVNKLTFDVSSLDAGVYFYSVSINGASVTKKLVVY